MDNFINDFMLGNLGVFKGVECFIYYDAPLLFSAKDKNSNLFIALFVDYPDRYFFLPVSENKLQEFKDKKHDILSMFTNSEYFYDVNFGISGNPIKITIDDIDKNEFLPEAGLFLFD